MVELDYILDTAALRQQCQRPDVLTDTDLKYDLVMPVHLRVGQVEVLSVTEDEYRHHPLLSMLPGAAWDVVPVLMLALFGDSHFTTLREQGHCDVIFLDPDLRLMLRGEMVSIGYYYRSAPRGEASYADAYRAFTSFSSRVRRDFLSVCPSLTQHAELGPWFRAE